MTDRPTLTDVLRPHWRTDCSSTEHPDGYCRWVKCRCGWESEPSSQRVYVPDMHEIWNEHLADALAPHMAAAWAEGVLHGDSCPGGLSCDPRTANPYRTGATDAD